MDVLRSLLLILGLLITPVATPQAIKPDDLIAFGRVLAEDPYQGTMPRNVKVVAYSNPNECLESVECRRARLFIAVIGDGELPEYKVYDAGVAVDWRFIRWAEMPMKFWDDERDVFSIELEKTTLCTLDECGGLRTRKQVVMAQVSLKSFRWKN